MSSNERRIWVWRFPSVRLTWCVCMKDRCRMTILQTFNGKILVMGLKLSSLINALITFTEAIVLKASIGFKRWTGLRSFQCSLICVRIKTTMKSNITDAKLTRQSRCQSNIQSTNGIFVLCHKARGYFQPLRNHMGRNSDYSGRFEILPKLGSHRLEKMDRFMQSHLHYFEVCT